MQYHFTQEPPLSLYIHFPWCVRKCPYCDFNSHTFSGSIPEATYIEALLRDLETQIASIAKRPLISIFMGGGTPSLFSGKSLANLLDRINQNLSFANNIEITLEANPGTVDQNRFTDFQIAGINRLSLGIQSLQDEKLKSLGRIHGRKEAFSSIQDALTTFAHVNLDLMHGLPGQTISEAITDLEEALFFQPAHLSWYQLTLEPNTWFYHHPPPLPNDDILGEIQTMGEQLLAEKGYQQYEVSAFSKPGNQCQHNRNYWEFGDYLGIGAGSHGKITDITQQHIYRHYKIKHPKAYLDANVTQTFIAESKLILPKDTLFEFMLNALRLTDGIDLALFSAHTGLPLSCIEAPLQQAIARELIVANTKKLMPTALGKRFLNDLVGLFLPEES